MLNGIRKRLERVVIENKNYDNLIKVYDREKALFYCDPPYHKTEHYYMATFTEQDHSDRKKGVIKKVLKPLKTPFYYPFNKHLFFAILNATFCHFLRNTTSNSH